MNNLSSEIISPVISEKSINETSRNRYTFFISENATKKTVTKAIEDQYKVDVLEVRIINIKGKKVRFGKKRHVGKRKDRRKAVVTIKSDQKIEVFDLEQ